MIHPTRLYQGMVLAERYRIEGKLGSGGMSHVYLAHDLRLPGKKWAVKESVAQPSQYREVAAEAKMLTALSHPFLPRIVDFITEDPDGYTYMVMDYIEGETLEQKFKRQPAEVDAAFIMRCADQLCNVLEYLHQHEPPIVFRDMKPSNVMITSGMDMRLIDFGIARIFKPEESQDTVKLGTIGFAAPEQYGSGQTDHRSDLYGLGALILYLATGGHYSEWMPGIESFIRNDIPRAMIPVIRKLLHHQPAERYQSAADTRQALGQVVNEYFNRVDRRSGALVGGWNKITQVIAVMGSTSGTGTTHTAVAIAHYLARSQQKVALVEMNDHPGAFARIQQVAVNGMAEQQMLLEERKFTLEGVDYWRESARAEVVGLLGGSYRFIILDLGRYQQNARLEEFLRADIPIVVGSGAEWRYQDVLKMAADLHRYPQDKWHYYLPLSPSDAVERLKHELHTEQVYSIPWHPDPFDNQPATAAILKKLFGEELSSSVRKRKLWFNLR
ncbi:serine/threonine protein kinase [Paenibacillus shenyangensis]|uniref:serine/threonine protein kinase n=1 Tax=Paenibacillus sp. A9 TaxID=1284352 RepID=UPI00037FD58B|nr:serine/threonine-protein kinase [Paenibacillus sp. A9]